MPHILAVYEKVRRYSDTWKHRRRMNNVLAHTKELTAGELGWPIQCLCVCVCRCVPVCVCVCVLGERVYVCAYMYTAAFCFLMSTCMHIRAICTCM